jgi:hypothetical protein
MISTQRIPRSGQFRRPAAQYSDERYCDDESFVQRQIHGLNSILQELDSAPPDQTADQEPSAFTRAETVAQSVGYPASYDESMRILGALADSSCWQHLKAYGQGLSEDQQKRIVDAVDKLKEAISAHESGRVFLSPHGEFNLSARGTMAESNAIRAWRWDDQIRRLKRDILECVEAIVNERANAFWSLGEVEPFRKQVETDALDILQRALACVDTRDLPLLSSTTMREAIEGIASEWVRKAQLEFPPALPSPASAGSKINNAMRMKSWADINEKKYGEKANSMIQAANLNLKDFVRESYPPSFRLVYLPTQDHFAFGDEEEGASWTRPGYPGQTSQTGRGPLQSWDAKIQYFEEWLAKLQELVTAAEEHSEMMQQPEDFRRFEAPEGERKLHEQPQSSLQPTQEAIVEERGKVRSNWLDKQLALKEGWSSDLDIQHNGGPSYNTIRSYRSGAESTRLLYVRGKLAKAFGCSIDDVPE